MWALRSVIETPKVGISASTFGKLAHGSAGGGFSVQCGATPEGCMDLISAVTARRTRRHLRRILIVVLPVAGVPQ